MFFARSGPTRHTIRGSDRRGDRARRDGRSGRPGPRRPPARPRAARATPPRSGSRCRSACGCSATSARPSRASGAACARRRRPSGRRGPSRSPTPAGRSPRAAAPAPRRRPAAGSARTRAASGRRCALPRRPGTGRRGSRARRPRTGLASTRAASARRRRRATASARAISSSGWQGFVTQSSAPSRSPRTRWLTDERPVQTITPSAGRRSQTFSRYDQPAGPSTARSITSTLKRMEMSASIGTGLASTRCCQPAASSRFASTCRKPVSESSTPRRTGGWPVVDAIAQRRIVGIRRHGYGYRPRVTPGLQVARPPRKHRELKRAMRGVRELSKQPGNNEGDLLADVHRIVADPL